MSVIWNSNPVGGTIAGGLLLFPATLVVLSVKTQFFFQVKINATSQVISGIFKFHQKLPKYFSEITTSVFVNKSLLPGVFPAILALYLKDSELGKKVLVGLSL